MTKYRRYTNATAVISLAQSLHTWLSIRVATASECRGDAVTTRNSCFMEQIMKSWQLRVSWIRHGDDWEQPGWVRQVVKQPWTPWKVAEEKKPLLRSAEHRRLVPLSLWAPTQWWKAQDGFSCTTYHTRCQNRGSCDAVSALILACGICEPLHDALRCNPFSRPPYAKSSRYATNELPRSWELGDSTAWVDDPDLILCRRDLSSIGRR
jgi:hypothetical protein